MYILVVSAFVSFVGCAIFVLPRLTPQNSFGMMLDGFPIKDDVTIKMLVCFLTTLLYGLLLGPPIIAPTLWFFCFCWFFIAAWISGWIYYYDSIGMLTNAVLGTLLLLFCTTAYLAIILAATYLIIMATLNYRLDPQKRQMYRYNIWVNRRLRLYACYFAKLLPKDNKQKKLILALLFIEDMSRPRIVRIFERMLQRYKKTAMSTGIMQVQSPHVLTDYESVELGIKLVKNILKTKPLAIISSPDDFAAFSLAWNGDEDYRYLLFLVYDTIKLSNK